MASRVIQDSDEEDDGGEDELSTDLYHIRSGRTTEGSGVEIVRKSGQSTDPAQFQTLYDINMAAIEAAPSDPPSSIPLPTFEELIRGPSRPSPITESAAADKSKLQRSKSINASSLTSISEPSISNKKAKRVKSAFNARDLTQVTTPSGKENAPHDMWDLPSDYGLDMYSSVKSRRAAAEKKSYGKQNVGGARVADTIKSSVPQQPVGSIDVLSQNDALSKDESTTKQIQISPQLPRLSRVNSRTFLRGDAQFHPDVSPQGATNTTSTSSNAVSIQVPRSTSEEARERPSGDVASTAISLPPPTREAVTSSESVDHGPRTFQAVSVVEAMTPSQKKQYKRSDDASDGNAPTPTVDTAPFSDLTSSRFNELIDHMSPSRERRDLLPQGPASGVADDSLPTSSSLMPSKRARSVSVSQESKAPPKTNKLRRIKTTEHRVRTTNSASFDIDLTPENVDIEPSPQPIVKDKKRKRAEKQTDNNPSAFEDLTSSQDVGLPAERYVPRPSSRRRLDNVIDQAADDVPKSLRLSKAPAKPSAKNIKASAQADMTEVKSPARKVQNTATHVQGGLDELAGTCSPNEALATVDSLAIVKVDHEPIGSISTPDHLTNDGRVTLHLSTEVQPTTPSATENLVNSILCNVTKIAKARSIDSSPRSADESQILSEVPSPVPEKLTPVPEDITPKTTAPKIIRKRKGRARTKTMPVFQSESIINDSDDDEPVLSRKKPERAKKAAPMLETEEVHELASQRLDAINEDEEEAVEPQPAATIKKKPGKQKKLTAAEIRKQTASLEEPGSNGPATEESFVEELTEASATSRDLNKNQKNAAESIEKSATGANTDDDASNSHSRESTVMDNSEVTKSKAVIELETPARKDKGPDKHSPLPSSVVRYRIGLSKKSKIAPLLKVRPVMKNT